MTYDVIVIGAGAAGLMCAIEAGRRGRSVLVLERNRQAGRKILISGGGRCNFTNTLTEPSRFYSQNPDFCRSALAAYPPSAFVALVEQHGIAYHEKKLGQLFCDDTASRVVDMLEAECASAGAQVRFDCTIASVEKRAAFDLVTDRGSFQSGALVIATGGLSVPQIGASGFGYDVAAQFGIKRTPLRPGLVPLLFTKADQSCFAALSGVALEASVRCSGSAFTESVLFTHRGVSGPAILQISNAWRDGEPIVLDLLPRLEVREVLGAASGRAVELVTVLSEHAPRRFVQAWCAAYAPSRAMNRYSRRELDDIARALTAWEMRPAATAGFGKAEVTLGGVDTTALHSKTMESRRVPGLHFVGEVVDVTGWLGGYNFQWAWASGFAAGQAV